VTPQELEALRASTTTTVEVAAAALGVSRNLAYRLAREQHQLTDGVPVLALGRKLVVPTAPLLVVLGHG
jgi:hypothetical protein